MADQVIQKKRRRMGGRSAHIRARVLNAALDELLEKGVLGLTIPAIAQRAGVHPTTLYRRWPDAGSVALEAVLERSNASVTIPDVGSLEADLELFLEKLDVYVRSPSGRGLLALCFMGGANIEPFREHFWRDRFAQAAVMVERAKVRGEIPSSVASRQLLELIISPVYLYAGVLGVEFGPDARRAHIHRLLSAAAVLK